MTGGVLDYSWLLDSRDLSFIRKFSINSIFFTFIIKTETHEIHEKRLLLNKILMGINYTDDGLLFYHYLNRRNIGNHVINRINETSIIYIT